jgi:hypothetical protein
LEEQGQKVPKEVLSQMFKDLIMKKRQEMMEE